MPDRDLIAEGRRLLAAAMPGPWKIGHYLDTLEVRDCDDVLRADRCGLGDAELIVYARNRLGQLLDDLEHAHACVAELEQRHTPMPAEQFAAMMQALDVSDAAPKTVRVSRQLVTNADELEALPDGTVIRTCHGTAAQKSDGVWEFPNEIGQYVGIGLDLPALVLWLPEEGE